MVNMDAVRRCRICGFPIFFSGGGLEGEAQWQGGGGGGGDASRETGQDRRIERLERRQRTVSVRGDELIIKVEHDVL